MTQARWIGSVAALLSLLATVPALSQTLPAAPAGAPDIIKRGEYLVRAGDCLSCHSKKDGPALAGGLYVDTPYGGIASPNITPDKETGIGNWSDDDFYRLMHEGLDNKGHLIYPVMPFDSYTKITREDDMAIKAYLFSLAPVHSPRLPEKLSFPYSIRESVQAWRVLFFKPETFKPDPAASEQVNRGAYLVEGLGHCGACHTPRNVLSGSKTSQALGGGEITGQGWFAPNISSDVREGIGSWTEDQLVAYLKTGVATGHAIVAGPMSEVVHTSLAYLTDTDVHDIAAYLKATPGKSLYDDGKANASPVGQVAYLTQCSFCHQENGRGISGVIPPLAGNAVVLAGGPDDVIRTVLNGMPAAGQYAPMPGLARVIPPGDIADIVNYVRTSWGNNAPPTASPEMVAKLIPDTATMLSGTSQCQPIASAELAAAIDKSGATQMLHEVNAGNSLEKVEAILPKLKAAGVNVPQADVINGLTSAYCPIVMADTTMPQLQRTQQLQRFSMLVFTGLTARDVPAAKN